MHVAYVGVVGVGGARLNVDDDHLCGLLLLTTESINLGDSNVLPLVNW